jgi:hypothetical protein
MIDWLHLQQRLQELAEAIDESDETAVMNLLRLLVPGFRVVAEGSGAPSAKPRRKRKASVS